MLRDVTERRLAERALRESEQRYRTVIEQAFDGVWLEREDSTILDVNPGACAMLGYSREELIGQRAADLVEPESPDGIAGPERAIGNDPATRASGSADAVASTAASVLLAGRSRQIAPGWWSARSATSRGNAPKPRNANGCCSRRRRRIV